MKQLILMFGVIVCMILAVYGTAKGVEAVASKPKVHRVPVGVIKAQHTNLRHLKIYQPKVRFARVKLKKGRIR